MFWAILYVLNQILLFWTRKHGQKWWQWCWWHPDMGDLNQFKLNVGDLKFFLMVKFLHVRDIFIGHQHHNLPQCNFNDSYLMLMPSFWYWWRELSVTIQTCHHQLWPPTILHKHPYNNHKIGDKICWWQVSEIDDRFGFFVIRSLVNWESFPL